MCYLIWICCTGVFALATVSVAKLNERRAVAAGEDVH